MTTPPCTGLSPLFDSTDILEHIDAAAICATCPLIDACRNNLADAIANAHVGGGPDGTWAGVLYANGKPRRDVKDHLRRHAEDAEYTDAEARRCAYRWQAGERSEYVKIGRRVYERRGRRVRSESAA